jgi:hypothetical protein
MSVPAITLPPVASAMLTDRAEARAPKPAETGAPPPAREAAGDVVSVSGSLTADLEGLLKEIADRGFTVTPMNEGAARAMAEEAGDALGALSLSIANANPDRLAKMFSGGE